jgi:hypothetical protein
VGEAEYRSEVERILATRLGRLRQMSYSAIQALPQSSAENVEILGGNATLMVSRHGNPDTLHEGVMVVVTVVKATLGGIASRHWEKGLIFSTLSEPRDATDAELRNNGG